MVEGLGSRVPLTDRLPGVYQEEPFVRRFVAAFDDALAPVVLTLDGLQDYIDPRLCPPDFLAWVAEWLGIEVDDAWPVAQRREIVLGAADLHRRRGTLAGIADAVRLSLGLPPGGRDGSDVVEVVDSGATTWSSTPGATVPGHPDAGLTVTVTVPDPSTVDRRRLDRVVTAVKPAHVPHTVVVRAGAPADDGAPRAVDAPQPEGPAQSPPGLSSPTGGA
jgi:phage tail-like protein